MHRSLCAHRTREFSYSRVVPIDAYQVCWIGSVSDVYRACLNAYFVQAYPLKPNHIKYVYPGVYLRLSDPVYDGCSLVVSTNPRGYLTPLARVCLEPLLRTVCA